MICFCGFDSAFAIVSAACKTPEREVMAMHLIVHHKFFHCPCKAMKMFRYSMMGEWEEVSTKYNNPTHSDWTTHFDEIMIKSESFEAHLLFHGMAASNVASDSTDRCNGCTTCGHANSDHDSRCCGVDDCSCEGYTDD